MNEDLTVGVSGVDDIGHREAWEMIPWLVNGRAGSADRAKTQRHLAHCAACREEHAFQSRLQEALLRSTRSEADCKPDFERLRARLDEPRDAMTSMPRRRQVDGWQRALIAAVVIEAIGLGALGSLLWQRSTAPALYRTLSAPEAVARRASLRIVFAPELPVAGMQQLLLGSRLQVVGGPSAAGVYSLAPVPASTTPVDAVATLAALRGVAGVRFVEPVDAGVAARP